jgi:hypothetical protein
METYILFVLGEFSNHEDVEYFSNKVIGESEIVEGVKYVIESLPNIVIVFDSELEQNKLSKELPKYTTPYGVKFYFLFKMSDMVSVYLPTELQDMMFKPGEGTIHNHEEESQIEHPIVSLDTILDKIETFGIQSLTENEKNFLDNFNK